jgi:predicted enzyme related to lactoylglutathione lyase
MPATFPRGRFVWHELMTTDPDGASTFYSKVVGWKTEPSDHDPSYRMWRMGKRPTGGLMRIPDEARRMGAPAQWTPYVAVPDVDQTVQQAEAMGARVHVRRRDIPEGRFAVLADPWGASFMVFTPSTTEAMGSDEAALGDYSWHEHVSDDWRKAWDFYSKLFGWQHAESMEMGPGNTYWMFKRASGAPMLGGMYNRPADMQAPPHWLSYVRVASADTAAAAAQAAGGRVLHGPMEVPGGGRIAMLVDPQGAAFAVHSIAARPARRAPARSKPKRAAKRKPARKAKPRVKKGKAKAKRRPKRRG